MSPAFSEPARLLPAERRVLFLCTGNYFRSRLAESIFNATCELRGVHWRAFSRGLSASPQAWSPQHDRAGSVALFQINPSLSERLPIPLCEGDLAGAGLIIALNEPEHRPLIQAKFPHWEEAIIYWNVGRVDVEGPESVMARIEERLLRMVEDLEQRLPPQPAEFPSPTPNVAPQQASFLPT